MTFTPASRSYGDDNYYEPANYGGTHPYMDTGPLVKVTMTTMGQPVLEYDGSKKLPHKPWWRKSMEFFTLNGNGRHRNWVRK